MNQLKLISRRIQALTKDLQYLLAVYDIYLIDINDRQTMKANKKLWQQLKKYQSEVKRDGTKKN